MRKPDVVKQETVYDGRLITVHRDTLRTGAGDTTVREVVDHPDSVAVVALDDAERVLLVRQYRHPVGDFLLELPAGLLDGPDEPPLAAAQRELAEETGTSARWWRSLVDLYPSPGMSGEWVRVFLARAVQTADGDAQPDPDERIETCWMPLGEAVDLVFSGGITNGLAVAGLLAAGAARRRGYGGLRAPDA